MSETKGTHEAFPASVWNSNRAEWMHGMGGLTKREYFAAQALAGTCSHEDLLSAKDLHLAADTVGMYYADVARHAVRCADALINALNYAGEDDE